MSMTPQKYYRLYMLGGVLLLASCSEPNTVAPTFSREKRDTITVTQTPSEENIERIKVNVINKVQPAIVQIQSYMHQRSMVYEKIVHAKTNNGSGVVVRSDGYVLTNSHCIPAEAYRIKVLITYEAANRGRAKKRKKAYEATLVARNETLDLALIKLQNVEETLAHLRLNTTKLQEGEIVFALGHPWGQKECSCLPGFYERLVHGDEESTELILHSAQIRPGNSGGALVDGNGDLIGINCQIIPKQLDHGDLGVQGLSIPLKYIFPFLLEAYDTDRITQLSTKLVDNEKPPPLNANEALQSTRTGLPDVE